MSLPREDLDHILTHAEESLRDLKGARVFITGGTGFFGKWIVESFIEANKRMNLQAQAVVLTRNQVPSPDPSVIFWQGDISCFEFLEGDFSHLIHAATPASTILSVKDPFYLLDTIVLGTRRVLEFAVKAKVRKMLFTSSGAVYGKQPQELPMLAENSRFGPDPLNTDNAYAEGKRMAEQLCALFHKGNSLDVKVARCFAFVGPTLPFSAHFAIGNFLDDVICKRPIVVKGDGTALRSYMYASDLMIWLWTILARGKSAHAYNVGSEDALTVGDLAKRIGKKYNTPVEIQQTPNSTALPERYVPSTRRAREELGLQILVPLDQSIEKTMKWAQEQSK